MQTCWVLDAGLPGRAILLGERKEQGLGHGEEQERGAGQGGTYTVSAAALLLGTTRRVLPDAVPQPSSLETFISIILHVTKFYTIEIRNAFPPYAGISRTGNDSNPQKLADDFQP